jgi:hypothetical protein
LYDLNVQGINTPEYWEVLGIKTNSDKHFMNLKIDQNDFCPDKFEDDYLIRSQSVQQIVLVSKLPRSIR